MGVEGQWNENVRLWYKFIDYNIDTKVLFQGPFSYVVADFIFFPFFFWVLLIAIYDVSYEVKSFHLSIYSVMFSGFLNFTAAV